ncbi:MAG TPA: gamma-glutamylcyclotransferase family protein [Candidatus Nitrosotenuis sp.]|nr:gamma-glutamylcyclotransferase family protein [Candidatus Nitrosotenuis sp.]
MEDGPLKETPLPLPIFVYGSLAQEEKFLDVLGRRLEGPRALLPGYALAQCLGYCPAVEQKGAAVEGRLVEAFHTDYWVLDDYYGTEQGYFSRCTLEVEVDGQRRPATVYVAGPMLPQPSQ